MSDPRQPEAPVALGDLLVGKYRVEQVLGVGGMGVVVAAHHLHLDERVAIKFLLPEVARQGGEPVARFMREGRAAAKIRSEHVGRVTDVGALDDGTPFLVMEYLEGSDLAKLLEASGPLAVDDALDYVLQACEALAEAHAIGIVHRDLKPANLFLVRRADGSPCIKVLDFGISKMREAGGLRGEMTRTHATLGSPLYMSPEQLVSTGDVDARADLWSLGVILFELLTGKLPYEAETMPQLVAQVLQNAPARLRTLRPDLSVELDAAVMRCLQPATMRFQNIAELAEALAPFAPQRAHISIQRVTRVFGAPAGLAQTEPASTERASRPGSMPDASPHARTVSAPETGLAVADTPPRVLAQSGSLSVSTNRVIAGRPRLGLVAISAVGLLVVAGGVVLVMSRGQSPVAASGAPSAAPAPSFVVASAVPSSVASAEPPAEPPATAAAPATPTSPTKLGPSVSGARPRATAPHAKPAASKALPIPGDRQ
jgi:serine/threonine-protein kinase